MKINNHNNKYFSFLKESISKLVVVFLVFSIFSSVSNVNQTYAYFSDEATISGNTFTAGTLDIATNSDDLGPVSLSVANNYNIINQGSLPFEYEMTTLISGGSDTTFCGQLNISVLNGADNLYTGSLMGFDFTKLIGGAQDNLTFTITDSRANPAGKVCSFNLISKAWQTELDYGQGFTDTASTKAVVYSANTNIPLVSSGVVLNEFLPNPNGLEYGFDFGDNDSDMPQGEWIELYNNGDTDANMTGWYLGDSTTGNHTPINSSHILVSSPIVPAHGWLVVYMNNDIYNNDGDIVKLFDPNGVLIDSYSYDGGTYCDMKPTPGDDNETNPSSHCTSVPPNKSYARIPDGVGAWVDPIPTPGEPNLDGEVELLLENDSPVILDQTIDTLVKEIMGNSTLEVVEDTTTEQPATDKTTDGTITADQPAQDTEDTTAPTEDEDLAIEPAIEEVIVVEPVVKEVVSKPVVKEETEPIVPEVVESVITE